MKRMIGLLFLRRRRRLRSLSRNGIQMFPTTVSHHTKLHDATNHVSKERSLLTGRNNVVNNIRRKPREYFQSSKISV
jgi:hypothetical protein